MGTLKATDVGNLVSKMNLLYQPSGKCSPITDKPHMQDLVDLLRGYSDQVQGEADENGLSEDMNVAQWATDMASWRDRLGGYQAALDAATHESGMLSCEELYPTVVGPILDGKFAGALSTAGISNPAVVTVPDIAAPYMLGNQVLVYGEFQAQNFEALINYFIDEAKSVAKKVGKAAKMAAPSLLKIGVGLVLGVGAVSYALGSAKKGMAK